MMSAKQVQTRINANGYRVGAAIVTVVAFAAALGAPIKWN
jgi:isopropylmalate/homocitrate/citramalate synthase